MIRVTPVIQRQVRALCYRPYPLHKKGCPNFNKKAGCPPQAPMLGETLDLLQPIWAIYNRFALGEHVEQMQIKHPSWSDRQLYCVLYWQPKARKQLRELVCKWIHKYHGKVVSCPEAQGVNVTKTMAEVGIILKWPPKRFAYQIALGGTQCGKDVN